MYELIRVGEKTYYINCPAKMGIYKITDTEICLIDSGNDKDAGKKILNILSDHEWNLKFIINTHSNADHIGGNALLQDRLGIPIFSSGVEGAFTQYPLLEPSFLFGGYPSKEFRNKTLMAQPSKSRDISELYLPEGLQVIPLGGHFYNMIGVKTGDGVWFMADCVVGNNILEKYHVSFIYDTAEYLKTLSFIEKLEGKLFIPAHAECVEDIKPLAESNRKQLVELLDTLLEICRSPKSFDPILKQVFDDFHIAIDWNQYVLVGSTIRSHLSYLCDTGKMRLFFEDNMLFWQTK